MTRRALIAVTCVWLAGFGFGAYQVYAHETTAGEATAGETTWPTDSAIARASTGATLVMFAHPECGCTSAALDELAAILAAREVHAVVAFTSTDEAAVRASKNWATAGELAATRAIVAPHEAARFGARTSGFVVVYDARGARRFAGGITGSRGHAGDNVGRRAVLAALAGDPRDVKHAVFGCALERAARGGDQP